MRIVVLGSAAGGGVPQWNCACPVCEAARQGAGVRPRTQDSVAVSGDGRAWYLLNASPDVLQQIARTPALSPRLEGGRRVSPVAGVVLTNGDLDHCLGLLSLREWTPFGLYATRETYAGLVEPNVMFRTLRRGSPHVEPRTLPLEVPTPLLDGRGEGSGLSVTAFPVAGKVPLHLEDMQAATPGCNVGLSIEEAATGARLLYVPGAGAVQGLRARAEGAQAIMLDGTFWSDDELGPVGPPGRTARTMAHLPVGGVDGSLAQLRDLPVPRRIFTHLNNTNPMLLDGALARAEVDAAGWEIAEDGMELTL